MKYIKRYFYVLLLLFSNLVLAQIPCSSGFTLNGSSDFITIPNTDAINLQNTRNRTIEFWFRPDDITSRQVIYEEGAQVNTLFFFIEAGRIYAGGYRNDAGSVANRRFFRSALGDIEVGKWTHVALTLEDTTSPDLTFKFYIDGELKDTQAGLQINTHSGNNSIGRNGGELRFPSSLTNNWNNSAEAGSDSETYNSNFSGRINNRYAFEGSINLLRIWNVARTETQINDNKSTELTTGTSLVAYQNGDQMNYESNGSSSINRVANANGSGTTYTWTGNSSAVYFDNSNWSGSSPDPIRTQEVVINSGSNNPSITTEVNIGRLTVNAGAEIIVQNGATLNVFYTLTNNGTITVEDGGALIYHACNSPIAGSGTFDVKRDTPTYSNNFFFSYWSSPVVEADASPSTVFSDAPNIYKFMASEVDSDWAYNGTNNLIPGIGYAVRSENTGGQLRTFSGKINEGDVEVDVFYSSNFESEDPDNVWSTAGDNLVGNPYSSAIDWDLVISDTDNSDIEGTVYFWNQNSVEVGDNNVSDYLQYNATGGVTNTASGKIGTGQGFFVRTMSNSTITFKTTHQIAGNNNQFFKSSQNKSPKKEGRSWFTFTRGNQTNTLLIGFIEGATNKYDRLYDAPFNINQKSLGFYSISEEGQKIAIQGLPELTTDKKEVKLGYVVDEIGEYSIAIQEEHINEDYNIYLTDTEKNVTINLRKTAYTFSIEETGENTNRFKLEYVKKSKANSDEKSKEKEVLSVEEIDFKDFIVYVDSANELIIEYTNSEAIKKVDLYNIQGRRVISFNGNQVRNVSNVTSGIYIVDITLSNGKKTNNKIIIPN
jgi:hypothetical protein